MNKLYIIRGLPGSGKSTLAHQLTDNVVEADMFMYENGIYKWSANKLYMAHKKCEETVEKYMLEKREVIAVANTFVKKREYKKYIDLANNFNYNKEIIICKGNYGSIHNVPNETMIKMSKRFEE